MRFTVSVSVKIIPLLHPFYFQKFSLKSINNFVKPLGTWLSSLTILSLLCVGCGGGSASVPANNGGVTPVIVAPPVGTISLQAGSLGGPGNINGVGAAARFGGASIYGAPYLLAGNGHGDVYTSDDGTSVRKISAAGVVTTLAGINGISGAADGLGSAARFEGIYGIAADSVGNVYVLDNSTTVRKISITGMVTTLAGKYGVLGVVDGVGSAARFNGMHDIATDPAGNVYIRTGGENAPIRKISPAGVVTTLEGGFNSAQFAVDAIGNIYSNYGCFIEKRTPVGAITTLAGIPQFCHDTEIQMDGIGSAAIFSSINGIAVDAQSNVFITDLNTVRKITAAGAVSTVAGKPGRAGYAYPRSVGAIDGLGSLARFNYPRALAVDVLGNIIVADAGNYTIRKITPEGNVSTLAGAAVPYDGDVPTASAIFNSQMKMAVNAQGDFYATSAGKFAVWKISASGLITEFAGTTDGFGYANGIGAAAQFAHPDGLVIDKIGNVFVGDVGTIRKITPEGLVSNFAHAGIGAMTIDINDNIYMVNGAKCYHLNGEICRPSTVLKITPAGVVSTIPGIETYEEASIASDKSGNIYVNSGLNGILKISPTGIISTYTKLNSAPGYVDGNSSESKLLSFYGMVVDNGGNVLFLDGRNNAIRKIAPDGTMSTIVGQKGLKGVTLGPLPGSLSSPTALTMDANGILYVRSEEAILKIQYK